MQRGDLRVPVGAAARRLGVYWPGLAVAVNRPYYRPNNTTTRGQISKILEVAIFPDCQNRTPTPTPLLARAVPTVTHMPTGVPQH